MLKYIGKGFIPGIPARDLSDEEAEQYGGETKLLNTGMYQKIKKQAEKAKDKEEGE